VISTRVLLVFIRNICRMMRMSLRLKRAMLIRRCRRTLMGGKNLYQNDFARITAKITALRRALYVSIIFLVKMELGTEDERKRLQQCAVKLRSRNCRVIMRSRYGETANRRVRFAIYRTALRAYTD